MEGRFGVGAAINAPFGSVAVGEYNLGVASVNVSLGYQEYGFGFFHLGVGGDYNFPGVFSNSDMGVDLYASVGGKLDLGFNSNFTMLGIGFPISLSYIFEDMPMKVYTRAVPGFIALLGWSFDIWTRGEVGAMYYF